MCHLLQWGAFPSFLSYLRIFQHPHASPSCVPSTHPPVGSLQLFLFPLKNGLFGKTFFRGNSWFTIRLQQNPFHSAWKSWERYHRVVAFYLGFEGGVQMLTSRCLGILISSCFFCQSSVSLCYCNYRKKFFFCKITSEEKPQCTHCSRKKTYI